MNILLKLASIAAFVSLSACGDSTSKPPVATPAPMQSPAVTQGDMPNPKGYSGKGMKYYEANLKEAYDKINECFKKEPATLSENEKMECTLAHNAYSSRPRDFK